MNRKQKICLWVGIAAIVLMGLFPPWVIQIEKRNFLGGGSLGVTGRFEVRYTTEPGPYSWINNPPATAKFIDLYRLGLQFFIVAVVTAGLLFILKNKSPIENKSPMTFGRLFVFAMVSSIGLGFVAPTIIIGYFLIHDRWNWDNDMLKVYYIGLFFFVGIWILYGIIRWAIIPFLPRVLDSGRKKESNNL